MNVQKNVLCPFHWKPRPSGVSLESPGLQNIPLFPGNRAEVSQNHDARKAVSTTLSVLKLSGAIFRPCPFNCKLRPSEVSLASPGIENIRQLPGNRAEVGQNYDARKAVSATLCAFNCKQRPSGVSLKSPGLENIPQVPGKSS